MIKYAIVIEKASRNFSAYVPDLPGCVATGRTPAQVKRNITEAIDFHLDGLREEGVDIPRPSASVDIVPVGKTRRRSKAGMVSGGRRLKSHA